LRAVDYFQSAGAPRDERLADAVDIIRSKRGEDGRWPLEHEYKGRTLFTTERLGKAEPLEHAPRFASPVVARKKLVKLRGACGDYLREL
jgi:hypothetical protein